MLSGEDMNTDTHYEIEVEHQTVQVLTPRKLYAHDVGYEKIGSFSRRDPFVIVFIYPRHDRPYIMKGSEKKVGEKITQTVELGLKAVIWKVRYLKFSGYDGTRKRDIVKCPGKIVGLPDGCFATIKPMRWSERDDLATSHFDVNRNHKYLLTVSMHTPDSGLGRIVLAKSFRNQPRCWPRCLDQFIPEGEKVPVKSAVTISD
jgi:hypothetical protein